MEIVIFGAANNSLWTVYADNENVKILSKFIWYCNSEKDIKYLIDGLKNKTLNSYSTDYLCLDVSEGIVAICRYDDLMEMPDFNTIDKFETSIEKFIELLEKFEETLDKKPSFIILKISGNEFSFEEDYQEICFMERSKSTIGEKTIKNSLGSNIHNGLINGGFHLSSDKLDNLTISNEMLDVKNTISVDIRAENDFSFNRAMFENIYKKEDIISVINEAANDNFLYSIRYDDKEEQLFYAWTIARKTPDEKLVTVRLIYNEKCEVVVCYPIFEDIA